MLMSDSALIRLQNLLALKLGATELSDRVGGRYTYWRDMLAGNKSFGEKAARKIEESLDLPRGWLDGGEVLVTQASQQDKAAGLSPIAYELALLFDKLPNDKIVRAVAYNAATAEILRFLLQHGTPPIPAPRQVDARKTRHA